MNRGGGVEADCLTDFPDGRWIAPFLHAGGNDVEDFALARSECFGHGTSVQVFALKVKHLFVEQPFGRVLDYEHLFGQTIEHPFATVSNT
jgi:hypothetical protein